MAARFLKDEVSAMAGYNRLSRGKTKGYLNVLAKAKHPCQYNSKRLIFLMVGGTVGQFRYWIPASKHIG